MSKLIIYEFVCRDCGHKFEEMVKPEDAAPHCPHCQSENTFRACSQGHLDPRMGIDGSMPTMADKWAKRRKDQMRYEKSQQDNHGPGEYGHRPGAD